MIYKAKYFICLLIIFSSLTLTGQKAGRQIALDNYSRGNYELAYDQFNELLVTYPRDPLYKYYSAVCLINLKKDPAEADRLLEEALKSGSLKSLPDDAVFYLARAKHLQGNYDDAERTYNRYTAQAGKKKSRDLGVPGYIDDCRNSTGKISAVTTKPAVIPQPAVTVPALPDSVDKALGIKLEMQYRTDSLKTASAELKTPEPLPQKPLEEVIVTETVPVTETLPAQDILSKIDTIKPAVAQDVVNKPVSQEVTEVKDSTIRIREILNRPAAVFSVFEVLSQPVTDPRATIEINPEPPEGLIYRLQTAVFRNPVQLSYFKGIMPIYGIKQPGATVTTYYAGIFRRSADASKALVSVKAKGFKDAFVVAQVSNKTVSSERASILEKEWGDKPLFNTTASDGNQEPDTLPPTLVLKVEVARSVQPLKDEAIDPIRKLAGKRTFEMVTLENGSVAYLIGNFITFESAGTFADLLQKNGYRDAKVVAWLGRREIDIETARQLFEALK